MSIQIDEPCVFVVVGASYPQAIAHLGGDDENMPVEESGNMVIMALSYTQKSGDTSLVSANYNLLAQWAQYLIDDSLTPDNQCVALSLPL